MKKIAESVNHHPLTLHSLLGDALSFKLIKANHYELNDKNIIQLTVEAELLTLKSAFEQKWFGYDETVVLSDASFDSSSPITLKLVLSPALCSQLVAKNYELEHFIASVLGVKDDSLMPLAVQEYWFIVEATQAQPLDIDDELSAFAQLKIGFKTSYYESFLTEPVIELNLSSSTEPDGSLQVEILNFLESERLDVISHPSKIEIELLSNKVPWNEVILIDEENRQVTCYAVFPKALALEKLDSIALVLMNENFNLTLGAFELDYSSGFLRYRSTLLIYDKFNKQELVTILDDHLATMEQYLPAIESYLEN